MMSSRNSSKRNSNLSSSVWIPTISKIMRVYNRFSNRLRLSRASSWSTNRQVTALSMFWTVTVQKTMFWVQMHPTLIQAPLCSSCLLASARCNATISLNRSSLEQRTRFSCLTSGLTTCQRSNLVHKRMKMKKMRRRSRGNLLFPTWWSHRSLTLRTSQKMKAWLHSTLSSRYELKRKSSASWLTRRGEAVPRLT